jgi:Zn-finger protein
MHLYQMNLTLSQAIKLTHVLNEMEEPDWVLRPNFDPLNFKTSCSNCILLVHSENDISNLLKHKVSFIKSEEHSFDERTKDKKIIQI